MPLDGHSYLVAQGWTGKGTGLRKGAISRPLAIPQKKTLSGLGKDRDEAFPFWDHLFSAAAKSIQLKCMSDDDDEDDVSAPEFRRTTTGILSTRRPVIGTPADSSGSNTPDGTQPPRASLLSTAKREAAKRGLYARFFRGPILGPDSSDDNEINSSITGAAVGDVTENRQKKKRKVSKGDDEGERSKKRQRKELKVKLKEERNSKKRRKEVSEHDAMDDIARAERKEGRRRRREMRKIEGRLAQDGKASRVEEDQPCWNEKPDFGEIPQDTFVVKPPHDHQGQTPDIVDVIQDPVPIKKKKRKPNDASP